MAVCPNCGSQTGEKAVFCDQCGTRLPAAAAPAPQGAPAATPAAASVICPACGAGNVPGEAFCDFCGSPLAAPEPAAPPTVEPAPEAAPAGAPAPGKPTCPACGAEVLPGEAFCSNCGASLAQPPLPPEPVPEAALEAPSVAPVPVVIPEVVPAPEVEAAPAPEVEAAPPSVPEPVSPPPSPEPPKVPTCPACGVEVEAGDAFCSSCGAALRVVPQPAPTTEPPAPPPAPPPPSLGPRLVVVASGAEIPLPAKEELLIGREDPVSGIFPEVDLTPHGGDEAGVSRRHARLLVEGGAYFLEDLDSTNFSFVNKQKLVPRARQPLKDGDEIRLGRLTLLLRM